MSTMSTCWKAVSPLYTIRFSECICTNSKSRSLTPSSFRTPLRTKDHLACAVSASEAPKAEAMRGRWGSSSVSPQVNRSTNTDRTSGYVWAVKCDSANAMVTDTPCGCSCALTAPSTVMPSVCTTCVMAASSASLSFSRAASAAYRSSSRCCP